MSDPIRKLYKGTLRVLLVLLHDFPEFLCEYHLSFTDYIPPTCVQLRNLVLSAVPRPMKLQDPFSQNLNMENITECSQNPRLPADYANSLGNIRPSLDKYLQTRQPPDFPTLVPSVLNNKGTSYNMPLLNTLVTYVGEQGVSYMQSRDTPLSSLNVIKDSPSFAILFHLVTSLDQQGIFLVLNATVNQLRYPNTLTLYFNNFLLLIFTEIDNDFLREQLFRILLERLIVHRPHPWGLMCTFFELIKNPRFSFWGHGFSKFSNEISKVLENAGSGSQSGSGDASAEGSGTSVQIKP
jgi:CCR4-NOT transcription complex subunit 1